MPAAKMQQAAVEKKKAMQFIQYECIKSELKEEYDKKVGFLHKRLNKKAQVDPSFMLLNNLVMPVSTRNKVKLNGLSNEFGMDMANGPCTTDEQTKKQIQLQRKILNGPKNTAMSINAKLRGKISSVNTSMPGTSLPKMPAKKGRTIENRFDSDSDTEKEKSKKPGPNQMK